MIGDWQFKLAEGESAVAMLEQAQLQGKVQDGFQRLFGDLCLEEASLGGIYTGNQLVVAERPGLVEDKRPAISDSICPDGIALALLTLLVMADEAVDAGRKAELPRKSVKTISQGGYRMTVHEEHMAS